MLSFIIVVGLDSGNPEKADFILMLSDFTMNVESSSWRIYRIKIDCLRLPSHRSVTQEVKKILLLPSCVQIK